MSQQPRREGRGCGCHNVTRTAWDSGDGMTATRSGGTTGCKVKLGLQRPHLTSRSLKTVEGGIQAQGSGSSHHGKSPSAWKSPQHSPLALTAPGPRNLHLPLPGLWGNTFTAHPCFLQPQIARDFCERETQRPSSLTRCPS